jgi:asparagine synthase (glutamine-hydrolysing)
MSAQFGRWSFDGLAAPPEYLAKVREILSPYGPDGGTSYSGAGVDLLYHAFHTTKESRLEIQPRVFGSGFVIMWDGRLDNRAELIGMLDVRSSTDSADVSIVAAAFQRWGASCFAKLIGDWALSIWNPNDRALILAKDPIGTRHLCYTIEKYGVTWSTVLDPLVLFAGRKLEPDEEYIAGWLSAFPAAHLTPYVGIHSVPPSSFVQLNGGRCSLHRYWDFDPAKRIRYRTDAEYEEHFRAAFAQAVSRRLRSDAPVLAELSGGMDSSAIVCMADQIIARGASDIPQLDTVSYYDDSEPNWNERPFFTKVEEKRGRAGCHIDVGFREFSESDFENHGFAATPAAVAPTNEPAKQFAALIASQGNRVLLSGVGGDEVTGGVPTPIPQLEDLLSRGQFRALARELKLWALNKRRPWFHLLLEAARGFVPPAILRTPKDKEPPLWLNSNFVRRNRSALRGYESRLKLLGPLPSFQSNLATLNALRRQLGCTVVTPPAIYERCYPYLDCDLLAFLYAVPREQLVRPGRRRSLMRRALAGIVPTEILERKRKAFVSRSPAKSVATLGAALFATTDDVPRASHEALDLQALCEAVQAAGRGEEIRLGSLIRTLGLQAWLKGFTIAASVGPPTSAVPLNRGEFS